MAGEEQAQAIAPMWEAFLAQMTEAGASRLDVVQMALGTALVVLTSTQEALWPNGQIPSMEASMAEAYQQATGMVSAIATGLAKGAAQQD